MSDFAEMLHQKELRGGELCVALCPTFVASRRIEIKSDGGFSLTELMIVLAIVAILLVIGVPSYRSVTWSNRISYEVNELLGDVEFARSEALKQGLTVVVCPSADAVNCSAVSGWEIGWIVFATTGDCNATSGSVLRVKQAFPSSDTVTYTPNTVGNTSLCFSRIGISPAANSGLFQFNVAPANTNYYRCLVVSAVGHAQSLRQGQSDVSGTNCP